MSNALTLARPYARAAFSLARDHGRLPAWSSLFAFAAAVSNDERAHSLLGHPSLGVDEKLGLLLPPGDADPNFRQFLSLLAENGRLPLLADIAALFEALRNEEEQTLKVTVTSATAIDEAEATRISDSLQKRFGKAIQLSQKVDPDLIGGAIIDAGDLVIDGSVRGKLKRLETALAQ